MRAKLIYENINESNLVSKFRPGMKVQTKNNSYYIKKVESHNHNFDLIYVVDENGKNKIIASDWLEQNGTIIFPEKKSTKSEYPSMTTKQYIKEIKDAIDGLKQTLDDDEDPGSYIYDSAESMIYDKSLHNYLYKKYKKLYDRPPRYRRELVELLANDISNNYWS